jgi:hypothetical protein
VPADPGSNEPIDEDAPAELVSGPEPFGPVELVRWRKRDGRALLLFTERTEHGGEDRGA